MTLLPITKGVLLSGEPCSLKLQRTESATVETSCARVRSFISPVPPALSASLRKMGKGDDKWTVEKGRKRNTAAEKHESQGGQTGTQQAGCSIAAHGGSNMYCVGTWMPHTKWKMG